MIFGIISRTKPRSATNEVPKCRSRERALLRHHIIAYRIANIIIIIILMIVIGWDMIVPLLYLENG